MPRRRRAAGQVQRAGRRTCDERLVARIFGMAGGSTRRALVGEVVRDAHAMPACSPVLEARLPPVVLTAVAVACREMPTILPFWTPRRTV